MSDLPIDLTEQVLKINDLRRWCVEQAIDVRPYRGHNEKRTDSEIAKETADVAQILEEWVLR